MANDIAAKGQVFVCQACGKRSRDRYGEHRISRGWDESCAMHAVLCTEDSVRLDARGLVCAATAVGYVTEAKSTVVPA
jgi:hypothetical protein